jgi:hypothetical protein
MVALVDLPVLLRRERIHGIELEPSTPPSVSRLKNSLPRTHAPRCR